MQNKLVIDIHSFSYKKGGIPKDNTDNGGGFVFDCRGILNPGRIEEYKTQTGNDIGVQEFLETKTEMPSFLKSIHDLVSISINNYLERGFENLQINFGCTGGQHRSVYSAIKTAEFIRKNFPDAEVKIHHDEQLHLNLSSASSN
ncbi:RapZ C-terminal domain-containing protein [Epilithonimonas hungarica]|uniref:RapZ C-terminal domain-containing protein n=1 Tax=Epilithonimonas hungarica TaxID=454006 RepID=UPI000A4F5B27|nr:RNase adapter RapZ [Epilithonimonas hungarica]MPT32680.1 ATP-binding protein [Chryseobacterium sp.]